MDEYYDRGDNIFKFMEGCPIEDVKVCILGNDPCKDVPSSGYAFHESKCPSTEKILDFVDSEIDTVCNHLQDYSGMSLHHVELRGAKRKCNLSGWIEQGVLLLNSRLTFESGNEEIRDGWQIFTDFILEHLSDQVRNVVFMLLGQAVAGKEELIDKNQNIVMQLYHPAHYTYTPGRFVKPEMDWKRKLPFINANFYLWQAHGLNVDHIIDWTSIGWRKKRQAKRLRMWTEFFQDVKRNYGYFRFGSQVYFRDFIVRRNSSGFLTLEKVDNDGGGRLAVAY